jgi:hypothetical protein
LSKADYSGLRSSIDGFTLEFQRRRDGDKVYDPSKLPFLHKFGSLAGKQKGTGKIGLENIARYFRRCKQKVVHRCDAGVVDQNIEPPMRLGNFIKYPFDAFLIADIRLQV